MKKQRTMAVKIASLMVFAVLVGCDAANNADEAVIQELDKLAQVGNIAGDSAVAISDHVKREGKEFELTAAQEIGTAEGLVVDHAVGNIELIAASGSEIKVKTTVWFNEAFFKNDNIRTQVTEQAASSFTLKDGMLELRTHPKEDSSTSLWDWSQKQFGDSGFMIDYVIEVPEALQEVRMNNDVGKVLVNDLKGAFDLRLGTGEIQLNKTEITGNSKIVTEAGSVKMLLEEIDKDSTLAVNTSAGSITTTFAPQMKYTLDTQTELGQITGASRGQSDVNGGGAAISLSTSVGSIKVNP
ncbi:DUF4097 family beta strand repeat-containing protein [Paenibacillus glucanolyticus]|uniref:DUF4097 family beta strand repeat-containing protein n=1 Tax=Paenibacillus glucanolyticus TaxID=59843 RepID=UPI00096F0594|nr:DUF4097 family beta strand repeat-containing protein [Paenibacillus glucanolyticus]OMF64460.1 hypothetical protein BK142_31780 [Paenibacillus glucanolyticus]